MARTKSKHEMNMASTTNTKSASKTNSKNVKLAVPNQFRWNLQPPSNFSSPVEKQLDEVATKDVSISKSTTPPDVRALVLQEPKKSVSYVPAPIQKQDENTDGVKWTLEENHSSPERVCYLERERTLKVQTEIQTKLEKEGESLRNKNVEITLQLQDVSKENSMLKLQLKTINKNYDECVENAKKEKGALEQLCGNYLGQIELMKGQAAAGNQTLREKCTQLRERVVSLEQVSIEKERELFSFKQKLESVVRQWKEELETARKSHFEEMSVLTSKLEADRKVFLSENRNLKTMLEEEKHKAADLGKKCISLRSEVEIISSKADSVEDRLKDAIQREHDFRRRCDEMEQHFKTSTLDNEKKRTDEVEQIKQHFSSEIKGRDEKLKQLSDELAAKDRSLQTAHNNITKLESVLASEAATKDAKELKKTVQSFENKIKELEECSSSQAITISLLNVRLSSLNNILEIQDAELNKSDIVIEGQKAKNLLSRWRNKVYTLLVQLKTKEICSKEENIKVAGELQISNTARDALLLQKSRMENEIAEKNAENAMKDNEINRMAQIITTKMSEYQDLLNCLRKQEGGIRSVHNQIEEWYEMQSKLIRNTNRAFAMLSVYNQRIQFVSKRVQMMKDPVTVPEDGEKFDQENTDLKNCLNEQLQKEVDTLTKERDMLLQRIESESRSVAGKIAEVRNEYEDEANGHLLIVQQLRKQLENSETTRLTLLNELQQTKNKVIEMEETNELLQNEVMVERAAVADELQIKFGKERKELQDQLSEIQAILSNAQKEHAKTVLALRQQERQSEWELRSKEEAAAQQRAEYEKDITKMASELQALEKERNMLLTTIKQEGFKINFGQPRMMPEEDTKGSDKGNQRRTVRDVPRQQETERGTIDDAAKQSGRPPDDPQVVSSADITSVLTELQALSNVLLQEADDVIDTV